MMRGTKSIKNAKINHSVAGKSKEDMIHQALSEYFNVFREVNIKSANFIQKHGERNVDMVVKYGKDFQFILESDGKVHGDLENPTINTLKRNSDLLGDGHKLVVINHESIDYLLKIFKEKGMFGGVSTDDITRFIVVYRAWEEYSKNLAEDINRSSSINNDMEDIQ
jgi:hypothetical protein